MSRILLVDDSPTVRRAVADMLADAPGRNEIVEASNGRECLERLSAGGFDLVILDVEMPEVDGLATLKEMQRRGVRTPVLMLSALTQRGALTTFRALDLGALDYIPKPAPDSGLSLKDIHVNLVQRVQDLLLAQRESSATVPSPAAPAPEARPVAGAKRYEVLLIGASTGGPQALQEIFRGLPAQFPVPILVVQHMPPVFTSAFAERLNAISPLEVSEAVDGAEIRPGRAFVAPGNRHMRIKRGGAGLQIELDDSAPVFSHRPSIDVTFRSAEEIFGSHAAALLMTGMGRDGVDGMLRIRASGGLTLAQDEASSVVFGMNRRAIEAGAAERVVELKNVVAVLQAYFPHP
jgi:two-component system chemotaxis response regulator CheB